MQKNERQVNSNHPFKLGHLRRKFNFCAPKTPHLDAHTRYDVMRNIQHIFSFSALRISYFKMATSEGGSAYPQLGNILFFQLKICKARNMKSEHDIPIHSQAHVPDLVPTIHRHKLPLTNGCLHHRQTPIAQPTQLTNRC